MIILIKFSFQTNFTIYLLQKVIWNPNIPKSQTLSSSSPSFLHFLSLTSLSRLTIFLQRLGLKMKANNSFIWSKSKHEMIISNTALTQIFQIAF